MNLSPRVAEVVGLYGTGLTTAEIAARCGLARNTVRRYATYARADGATVPKPCLKRGRAAKEREIARLYRLHWTVEAIAQRLGLNKRSVQTYAAALRKRGEDLPRAPCAWSPPRRVNWGECCRLHCEGWTQRELAARYGVTPNAISGVLHQAAAAGIPTGPLGRWPKEPRT